MNIKKLKEYFVETLCSNTQYDMDELVHTCNCSMDDIEFMLEQVCKTIGSIKE